MYSSKCREQRNSPSHKVRLRRAFSRADARGDSAAADVIVDQLMAMRDLRKERLEQRDHDGDPRARRLRFPNRPTRRR